MDEVKKDNTVGQAEEVKIRCEACNRDFASQEALNSHNASKHNGPVNNSSQPKKSSNFNWALIILLIGGIIGGGLFLVSLNNSVSGNSLAGDYNVQKINLGFKNGYTPSTIRVKVDQPVQITLDNSVGGCFRSFTIRDLGISESSQSPSDTIDFTPTKKGTFTFACGMGMATGTIVIY